MACNTVVGVVYSLCDETDTFIVLEKVKPGCFSSFG